jgi:hypothetical protein
MNFQTMSKQRKFVLISAVIGIISMFLPWVDVIFVKYNGMHGKGIFVFICFLVAGALAYMGDQTKNLEKTNWFITLICGALAVLLMIWYFSDLSGSFLGTSPIGFGFYIAAIASLGVLASAYLFKSAGDTIKGGFDKLKNEISDKTKSDNPPNPGS